MKSIQQLREKYAQMKSEAPQGTPISESYAVLLSHLERSRTLQEVREFVAASLASRSVQNEDVKRVYRQFVIDPFL